MGMHYSQQRQQRMNGAAKARHAAFPAAGPVTVTKADGSTSVQPAQPVNRPADRPNRGRATSRQERTVT